MTITDVQTRRTELLALLGRQAETLATSDGWQAWLTFARRFRQYSTNC